MRSLAPFEQVSDVVIGVEHLDAVGELDVAGA